MKRKILALLLACMMVISMVPATVFAVDGEVADTTQPEAGYEYECDCADGGKKGDLIETGAPTCDTYGYEVYECTMCWDYIAVLTGSPLGHDWADATCTAPETCKRCGKTEGKANGHDWQDADCTTAKTCSVCNATEGKANGHSWTPATCTAPKTCTVCNATEGKENGHDWGDATCDQPATCKSCGVTSGAELGHDMAAATCTAPSTCKRCGVTAGDKLGHDMAAATCTVPPTCKRCGHKEGDVLPHTMAPATCSAPATCTVCGHEEGNPDDDAHVTEILQGRPATCQEDGYKFLIRCTVCDEVLTKSGVIEASEEYHLWSEWHSDYACSETESRICTYCFDFLTGVGVETQPKADRGAHTYGDLQNVTCTDRVCSVCAYECKATGAHSFGELEGKLCIDRECVACKETIKASDKHTPGAAATCTTNQICTVCNTELNPALKHDYSKNVTAPKCEAQGYTTYTCTRCDDSYVSDYTKATGHTPADFAGVAPTFENKGQSAGKYCSVCKAVLEGMVETDLLKEKVTFKYVVEGLSVTTGTITIKVYMVAENGVRIEALQWGMDFDENGLTLTGAKFELANLAGSITAKDTANAKGKVVVSAYSTDSEKGYYTFEANKEGYLFATLTFEVNEDVVMGTKIGFATEVAFTRPASFKNSYDFNAGTVETLVVETLGDITGEGDVDVNDLVVLLRAINAGTELKYEDYKILDMDQSGSVDGADLIKLRNLIAGASA